MDTKTKELEQVEQPRKALIPDVQIIPCTPEAIKISDRSSYADDDKLRPTTPEMPECLKSFDHSNTDKMEWNSLSTPPKPQCMLDDDEL